MYKSTLLKALAPTLVLFSTQAAALPFQSIDPRSLSMGGVGVASGSSANAAFMNPALLSIAREDEDFSLEVPIMGFRIQDPDSLIDEVDNYQDNNLESNLTSSINAFDAALNSGNLAQIESTALDVANASEAMRDQLEQFTNRPIQGELFGGLVIGIPSKKFGASVMLNGYVVGGGLVDYTESDQALAQSIIDDAIATGTGADPTALANNTVVAGQLNGTQNVVDNLTSGLEGRGAAIVEVGVSLSREVTIAGHDFAVGVTPKYVALETFDYRVDVNTAEFDADKGLNEYTDFNFDLGVAKDFGNDWKVGLVAKNLLANDYTTVRGNVIKIEPQLRAGVAMSNEWWSMAVDLDLVENEPVGFESKSQYLGLGAELDLYDWVQFRAGYRHNLSDSDTSLPTLGFGFSPFGVHMDLALSGNSTEIAASFQLGFRF